MLRAVQRTCWPKRFSNRSPNAKKSITNNRTLLASICSSFGLHLGRFWDNLIEDFSIFGGSKRPSNFHRFSHVHRFWFRLGLQLGAIFGAIRPKIEKMARSSPGEVLNTTLLWNTVYDCLDYDFWGVRPRFSNIFQTFCELPGLLWEYFHLLLLRGLRSTRPPALGYVFIGLGQVVSQFTKRIQEHAEDKAENQSVQTSTRNIRLHSFSFNLPFKSETSRLQHDGQR